MSATLHRLALWGLALFSLGAGAAEVDPPKIAAQSWALVDLQSGMTLATQNADARVEPASLTKLMSSLVVLEAIQSKKLSLTQEVNVSEAAWRAQGSRMFLSLNQPVRVDDLLTGMIVQSGNDATLALAEAVSGSEADFVERMNHMAKRLGMTGTHFANATGLPHSGHYSTARDLTLLAQALIRAYPQDYRRYAIKQFTYNRVTQANRNRLLWLDPYVDGIKTGHTDRAGYCLVASAIRDGRRLVSVVLGAQSDVARAQESQRLLNWGFQAFENVRLYPAHQAVKTLRVWRGTEREVSVGFRSDLFVSLPRGTVRKLTAQVRYKEPLLAPIARGQRLGVLEVSLAGKMVAAYPLTALNTVPTGNLMQRGWDTLLLTFQ